jgi:hypothetical protein
MPASQASFESNFLLYFSDEGYRADFFLFFAGQITE